MTVAVRKTITTLGASYLLRNQSLKLLQTLAYEDIQLPSSKSIDYTAFFLHGLLGSGRNWRSFARNLASQLSSSSQSSWRMILVDLRNHGKSVDKGGISPPHDMENSAADVANLIKSQGWPWPDVVIGHSMGGKVAMQFAESWSKGVYGGSIPLLKQLWVLDTVPGKINVENSGNAEVDKVLQTLKSLPSSFPSRKWIVSRLTGLGFSKSLSEWIGSSLKKSGEQETFAFNLDGAAEMLESYKENSYWSLLENPPKGMGISLVRAENSDRWDTDLIRRLEQLSARAPEESGGRFSVHVLPNSGHWVHVDNPNGLLDILGPELVTLTS